MIPAREATEILGINYANILNTPGMKKFYQPPTELRPAMFDLSGYLRERENKDRLYSEVTRFIEWLKYEKEIPYAAMARKTGLSAEAIRSHSLGFKGCYKIAKAYKQYIEEFDK